MHLQRELVQCLVFLPLWFSTGFAGDCRGSAVDSGRRSWIEATRPLPALEPLRYIGARFCTAEPVIVQVWNPQGRNRYQLLWQRELLPDAAYLGQVQVFPVPEDDRFQLRSTYRYGLTARGTFPVDSIFDTEHRTGRQSVLSVNTSTITMSSDGGTRMFDELKRPIFFDVWFCAKEECPSEEELIRSYEEMEPNLENRNNFTDAPPDECRVGSLHAAGGRIMLEEHRSFLPRVVRAVEFYLCDDTLFHLHLWELVGNREFRLIWSKEIMPDENSGGGYRRQVLLTDDEVVFLQPHYRLGLHVPDQNKRMPVPSTFSFSENTVFSEKMKEKFHKCDSQLFEEVAFPYNFRIRLCSTTDCSDSEETWTAESSGSIETTRRLECPTSPPDPDTEQPDWGRPDTPRIRRPDAATTEQPSNPEAEDESRKDKNRTKDQGQATNSDQGEQDVGGSTQVKSSSARLSNKSSILVLCLSVTLFRLVPK